VIVDEEPVKQLCHWLLGVCCSEQ